jgi:multisubunit Na+/H+ antiporter MnhC subunit
MDAKRTGIRVLGWLSLIVGSGLALLLIRGVYLGTTRGFEARRPHAFWIVLGYLLFLGLAVYLFNVGQRALSVAKGSPRPRTRFGWGRIVVGAIFLYSSAVQHFHLIPVREVIKPLEPANETQAGTMKVTAIIIALGCLALILSGIWRGFRPHRTNASA